MSSFFLFILHLQGVSRGRKKNIVITDKTCILIGKALHNIISACSRLCGNHRINYNVNTPQVEKAMPSGGWRHPVSNLVVLFRQWLCSVVHKVTYSVAHSYRPACSFNIFQTCWLSYWQGQTNGKYEGVWERKKERKREIQCNNLTDLFCLSIICQGKTDKDLPVPLASQLNIWHLLDRISWATSNHFFLSPHILPWHCCRCGETQQGWE